MYFCIENYSERGLRIIVATTEIINKALRRVGAFLHFNQNERTGSISSTI
ncbi:hypothetical protein ACSSV5_002355 [Psychroflexus sp. MBR-150]|jgi:hypothetical protein